MTQPNCDLWKWTLNKQRVGESHRRLLYRIQCGRCFYCFRPVKQRNWTVDHVVPKAHGGGNGLGNKVGCCFACNTGKSGYLVDDDWVQERLQVFRYLTWNKE